MDCATFKELAALYALGVLSPEERRACEVHLAAPGHHGCIAALDAAARAVAALDGDAAPREAPPPAVWAAIEARILPGAQRARRRRRRAMLVAGAALLSLLALVVVGWRWDTQRRTVTALAHERDACRQQVTELERAAREQALRAEAIAMLRLPGTQLFALARESKAEASANGIIHTGLHRVFVMAEGLPRVADHEYEMWIARRGKVVAAGVVETDDAGRAVFRIDYDKLLASDGPPDAVMITIEPRGGPSATPGPTVLLGTIHS